MKLGSNRALAMLNSVDGCRKVADSIYEPLHCNYDKTMEDLKLLLKKVDEPKQSVLLEQIQIALARPYDRKLFVRFRQDIKRYQELMSGELVKS